MENKNKISKIDIITLYMELVSESKKRPKSIKQFCKKTDLDKKVFYHNFSSLEKVEKFIFKTLFKNSLAVLEESEEFGSFDEKNKAFWKSKEGQAITRNRRNQQLGQSDVMAK